MRRPDDPSLLDVPGIHWLAGPASFVPILEDHDVERRVSVEVIGEDSGRGALLAMQPALHPWHYRSREELSGALTTMMERARSAGLISVKTVVVFPELIGLGLYFSEEYPRVSRSKTVREASLWAMLDEKAWIFLTAFRHSWERPYEKALLAEYMRVKAPRVAQLYQEVFSSLAEQFGVTIVAGSVLLPNPEVRDGRLVTGPGHPLESNANAGAVFMPDGSIHPRLAIKRHPTLRENRDLFVAPRPQAEVLKVETPAGRLAVMICADAWHLDVWRDAAGAELVASPSWLPGSAQWLKPWQGYDHAEEIEGLPESTGETQREAWLMHAMPGRIGASGARAGITAFLRGDFFELESSGQALAWFGGRVAESRASGEESSMLHLWL